MKKTEDLISELVGDSKINRVFFSPIKFTIIIFFVLVTLQFLLMHMRLPFNVNYLNWFFLSEVFFATISVCSFIYLGFLSLAPRTNRKTPFVLGSFFTFCFVAISLFHSSVSNTIYQVRSYCEVEAFVLSCLTVLFLHFIIKKFPLFDFQFLPKILFIATPLIVSLLMHTTCSIEFVHVLECHVLPAAIPGFLYISIRKKFIKA